MSELSTRIAEVLAIDPAAGALEFDGTWRTYGQLADTVGQTAALVPGPGAEVGILLRNRPVSIGFLLGVLVADGCIVTINPGRGRDRTRDDVAELDLPVLCGQPADLAELVPDGARATTVAADELAEPLTVEKGTHDGNWPGSTALGADRSGPVPVDAATRPGVAVRMLTSGTTGPPKRIDLTYATLQQVLVGNRHYGSTHATSRELRSGVAVVSSPLVHLGGLFRVLSAVTDGRSFSFLERFTVDGFLDAVRRHRPATASLVPTALRMVLEADPDPADLVSLRSVVSGTARLDPDDADAFEARFGVPVLGTYAATEFGGSVAGWNLKDHQAHWADKRGSVGRAQAGCALRVVDAATGRELPADADGVLEVRADHIADGGWVRTTDLARVDADGFVFILGRADEAIIRGGFKVLPETVKAALERHPAVRGAAVIGRADRRLGAVPVAAVELREGAAVTADELLAHAAAVLAPYEVPTEIRIVDELPRTESGKVTLAAVGELFAGRGAQPQRDEATTWT